MACSLKIEAGWRPLSGSEARSAGDNGTITSLISPPATLGRCRYHATSSWGHTNVVCERHTSFCCVFLHFPIFLVGPCDRANSWGLASPRPCCTVRSCPLLYTVLAEQGVSRKRIVLQVGTGVLKRAEGWLGRELLGRAGSEHSMTGGGLG